MSSVVDRMDYTAHWGRAEAADVLIRNIDYLSPYQSLRPLRLVCPRQRSLDIAVQGSPSMRTRRGYPSIVDIRTSVLSTLLCWEDT